ncbi:hypothetical protein TVNIR_1975 [Thioalkalivibrio nitratireducens DSM 14787]|uniref:Uncharacterized protein n=1 Tax=Thioalkalivibrio nitratireducens (strain DSM 14787 / UNIQEM 213 / ALEN2) TaxID=1255043 RepID=L0DZ40_THIND|nr:hypothetical protein [Thioalkalivibrio nitratireducens]AGA33636.1 hypothetical protein TVNIR_1975 [Thioalkalivibrio nitratireducens DSM 14787]
MHDGEPAVEVPEVDPSVERVADPLAGMGPVRAWIVRHDRSLLFASAYVTLTIVLSVFVSYFWLLAVVAVHILLEWLKKGYLGYRPGLHRTAWTVWDTKFDVALVFLAFTLLSYTGVNAGVAGAQSATRAGLLGGRLGAVTGRAGSLFARLGRLLRVGGAFRGLGIKAVDVFFSARVLLFRKADMARAASDEGYLAPGAASGRARTEKERAQDAELLQIPEHLPWQRRLGGAAWFVLIVIAFNVVAVLASPLITDHSYLSLFQSLGAKLHPWPL